MNREIQSMGGQAVAKKCAPPSCLRCGKEFPSATPWHSYLGHLGLHGLADKYFGGDIKAAQKRLWQNGNARNEEGTTWRFNGAFPPYRPIRQYSLPIEFFNF